MNQDDDDVLDFEYTPAYRLISSAIHSRPEYELRKMLSLHKSDSLKTLARAYKMKKYSSSKKSVMIDYLCTKIANPEFMESILLYMNDEEYAFFESVVLTGKAEMSASEAVATPYHPFRQLYFLEIYYISEKITFVVPEVIREIFTSLSATSFPSTRKRYAMINSLATAFSSLYGVVDFDYFIDVCNKQLQTDMDFVELANILYKFIWVRESPYNVFGPDLIHAQLDEHTINTPIDEDVVEESNDEVDRIDTLRGTIPIRQFPLEEILMYSDPNHFEHTPAHERLISFLEEFDSEMMQIPALQQYVLTKVNETLARNDEAEVDFRAIDTSNFESDKELMKRYGDLIRDVERHTRKWSKNGWTLAEIEALP